MRYKGLTIVLFAVVTIGFVFGFLDYHKKLDAMLGKEIVQADTGDFILPTSDPDEEVETPSVTPNDTEVIVPSLTGLSEEEAVSELKTLMLVPQPEDEYSSEYEKGETFGQSPSEGIKVKEGTKVSFSVSLGKNEDQEDLIIVPNLIGMAKADAENKLKAAGFNVGYEYNPSEHYDEGFVYSQNYKVDAKVSKGTQVTIRISTGQ